MNENSKSNKQFVIKDLDDINDESVDKKEEEFYKYKKTPTSSYIWNYFILYLPVIIIYSLIFIGYIGYITTYISVLLNADKYDSNDYPFQPISDFRNGFKKGLALVILSSLFFVLLLISITKTVFINPGYFPSVLDLENKLAKSQTSENTNDFNTDNFTDVYNQEKLFKYNDKLSMTLYQDLDKGYKVTELHDKTLGLDDHELDEFLTKNNFLTAFNNIILNKPLTFSENMDLRNKITKFMNNEVQVENRKNYYNVKLDDYNTRFKSLEFNKIIFCSICLRMKVERSHHCRQCGKCVLKMDHHCPWLANCIGFYNYKYFILTDIHGLIACTIVLSTYWEAVIGYNISGVASLGVCFFSTFSFSCVVGLFAFLIWLAVSNFKLIFNNLSLIENADKERFPASKLVNIYDIGVYKNLCAVLGKNPLIWFLPFFANYEGNGFTYPTIYDIPENENNENENKNFIPSNQSINMVNLNDNK